MSSDHQQHIQAWPSASKKRRVLALYVDFLLFSAAVALVCWALAKFDPSLAVAPLWMQITTFLIVEAIIVKAVASSPGHWSLGIYRAAVPGLGPAPAVSPDIANSERWWTVLLGVLIALEGTKMAVRWAMWHPPIPFMGAQLEFVPSDVLARREYQGLPPREGEVEIMRRWAPMLVVGGPALMLAWLFAANRRFSCAA